MAIRGKRYYLEFEFWTARQLAEFPKEDICKFIAEKFNEAKKEGKFQEIVMGFRVSNYEDAENEVK